VDADVLGLELLVEIRLQELAEVVGQTALDPPIHEVDGLRVGSKDPAPTPLNHPIKVPGPFLPDALGQPGALLGRGGSRLGGGLSLRVPRGDRPRRSDGELISRCPVGVAAAGKQTSTPVIGRVSPRASGPR
jgi:hypothetical protein